ncbi:MAG: alkaline phosphatase family protein, partial [Myxococcaceae bacterium]|nr:alkaline phosphatase family protein [Myxococcaceae bacterium]
SSGGGASSAGGGAASSGGGASSSGGGTASSGGGASSSGGGTASSGGGAAGGGAGQTDGGVIQYVFVIAMENRSDTSIYGNDAGVYLNKTLMAQYAHATNFTDALTSVIPSEPHYVYMEAATNTFNDYSFFLDSDPSNFNSTSSTAHVVGQLKAMNSSKTWRSYQEGMNATTGDCPINSDGFYAAKHDPFVFFNDVSGNPPNKNDAYCKAHHKAFTTATLQADLSANDVANYTFITPDLCNDMHGAAGCSNGCTSGTAATCVGAGDQWLATNVPPILNFLATHEGVLFIVWDEPEGSDTKQPFVAVGPHVKPGFVSTTNYTLASLTKSLDEILGLPVLAKAAGANDFKDLFQAGHFP